MEIWFDMVLQQGQGIHKRSTLLTPSIASEPGHWVTGFQRDPTDVMVLGIQGKPNINTMNTIWGWTRDSDPWIQTKELRGRGIQRSSQPWHNCIRSGFRDSLYYSYSHSVTALHWPSTSITYSFISIITFLLINSSMATAAPIVRSPTSRAEIIEARKILEVNVERMFPLVELPTLEFTALK